METTLLPNSVTMPGLMCNSLGKDFKELARRNKRVKMLIE